LTVKIIEELKKREYKVATIKHAHHSLDVDKENTDTNKHKRAGSDFVVGIGDKTFFNIDKVYSLDRVLFLIKVIENPDFVVIEGFKNCQYLKISTSKETSDEFTMKTVNPFEISENEIQSLVADVEKLSYDIINTLYTDECGYTNGTDIGKAIIKGELKSSDDLNVSLSIDENNVAVNPFVNDFIKNTLFGMLKTLKTKEFGVKDFDKIELVINKKNKD
jgi:molybdopterin-guanine dinucleotide biosynthesis protein B